MGRFFENNINTANLGLGKVFDLKLNQKGINQMIPNSVFELVSG
jgi:hypothetical protein